MNRADTPISVIMPTYNGRRFIGEALESIFRQRHAPAEIIVVDDGSTDGTDEALQPYQGRIRIFSEPHRGLSGAMNWGIAQARGDLIAFLDADDTYLPQHLEGLAQCLAANPRAGLVHSGWRFVAADGTFLRLAEPWREAPRLDLKGWLLWKPARMGATLVERRWLERAGGFDETLRQAMDVDLMLRLAWAGCRSVWLRQATLCYRLHADNVTRHGTVQAEDLELVLDRFFSLPRLPGRMRRLERQVRTDTAIWTAWNLWRTGYRPQAVARLQASLALAGWTAQGSALQWMMRFHVWTQELEEGRATCLGEEVHSLLREAAGTSGAQWEWVEAQYELFRRVWWPCSLGEAFNIGSGEGEASEGGRALSQLSEAILLGAPRPVQSRAVAAVWDALTRRGLVGEAEQHEVIRLYLAVLSNSLSMRDGRRALAALGKALGEGFSQASGQAWRGFLRRELRGLGIRALLPIGRSAPSPHTSPREKGLVSVIIAAHNQRAYITQAVESVLSQDYPQREVILVDDGSTDGTGEALAGRTRELTYVRQENQGPSAARNRGLGIAHGEFILFLDGDDYLLPGGLRAHAEQLEAHSSHGFSHSGWRLVDAHGEAIADQSPWEAIPRLDLEQWLMWKPVFLGSMMFRRSWLERSGGFDSRLMQAEDVDLVLRLALLRCRGDWIRSFTTGHRLHEANLTRDSLQQARDLEAVILRFFRKPAIPRRIRQLENRVCFFTLMWISWYLVQCGQVDAAGAYLGHTLRYTRNRGNRLVLDWLNDLVERARREPTAGVSLASLRALWPVFRRASMIEPGAWGETERALSFWLDVWQAYAHGDLAGGGEALGHFPGLTTREVIQWTRLAVLRSGNRVRPADLESLWEDAFRAGVVAPRDRPELVSLYLALAARALQRGWRRPLWQVALPVLRQLGRPRGWGATLRASVQLGGEAARWAARWS